MTALKPWCIWVCTLWGHISLEQADMKTHVSLLCGSEGSIQWFRVFPGEASLGWRIERWVLFCFRGALMREVCSPLVSVNLLCCHLLAGRCLILMSAIPRLTVTLWTAFLHPDNSLFIPDCSVLQTSLKFGGKWKIITLQVENYFNCHSDVLVHRNLLSTFHRRELLILLLPFCQAFSLPTRSPSFLSDNSPPLYSGPKFSLTLVCRAIPFFSLFLTLSFQTMTLEVLTFDSQYFDKVFS